MLSLTEDVGTSDASEVRVSSIFLADEGVATVVESLGADVGGRERRRREPEMLKDEREERDEVEGLGRKSGCEFVPSVCDFGDNGDLRLKTLALLLLDALSRGLATALSAGLPL